MSTSFTFLGACPSCAEDKYQNENVVSEAHDETELNCGFLENGKLTVGSPNFCHVDR